MKYIFITGGVVSGLGKGICAASLGRLLKQRGLRVRNQKFDPYLNVDPGTMNLGLKEKIAVREALKKIEGTDAEKLLKEHSVI